MVATLLNKKEKPINVLIADDSIVFRRLIRDIFSDSPKIRISGEAKTGIEALDMVLKLKPDVILMDMEMPLMDGMTALQHLMIHCPTPTIMLSSLTPEGTTRSFDALKNGAVDFIAKVYLFEKAELHIFKKILHRKVLNASCMTVRSIEPDFLNNNERTVSANSNRIVFCEDCGGRNIVENDAHTSVIECTFCGDIIELVTVERYRRNSFMTVFGGGKDSFRNLLSIIPKFDQDLAGSIMVVVDSEEKQLTAFCEYLAAISRLKVLRARPGMNAEAGHCYIASTYDNLCLKPFSTKLTFNTVKQPDRGIGAIDLAMASVSMIFKNKSAGVLLASNENDGLQGLASIIKNSGKPLLIDPTNCLAPNLVENAMKTFSKAHVVDSEAELVDYIQLLYKNAQQGSASF